MLPLYHWEWNQVHRLAVLFKARVTYLRYTHAISYERLSSILGEVFGLKISEGAIANLLLKVKISLDDLCKSNTTTVAAGKINLFR
ncbi:MULTISPECIES: hypothetical protein [unclassified Microcoleus]